MARKTNERPYSVIALFTDADTGRKVCVSGMWMTTCRESDSGTVITFLNGDTVTVEESLLTVASALAGG